MSKLRTTQAKLAILIAIASTVGLTMRVIAADRPLDYRILSTSRTSTMELELNRASAAGFRFSKAMGGKTAGGGPEIVVAMVKETGTSEEGIRRYRLLATSRTSTMQKELQQAAADGYRYLEQTVFETAFGGHEVVIIMEFDPARKDPEPSYRLLATSKTSTMQQELRQAGDQGYSLRGLTVAKTAAGGDEIVAILQKD